MKYILDPGVGQLCNLYEVELLVLMILSTTVYPLRGYGFQLRKSCIIVENKSKDLSSTQ